MLDHQSKTPVFIRINIAYLNYLYKCVYCVCMFIKSLFHSYGKICKVLKIYHHKLNLPINKQNVVPDLETDIRNYALSDIHDIISEEYCKIQI